MLLKELSHMDEVKYTVFVQDWKENGEEKITPFSANLNGLSFNQWLKKIDEDKEILRNAFVPAETLFLEVENKLVGALQLRYKLNQQLRKIGGNIGYGVAPSQRGKGYANELLKQGLVIFKKQGFNKILVTCDKENTSSKMTIIRNGGEIDNEIIVEGQCIQRYWIKL